MFFYDVTFSATLAFIYFLHAKAKVLVQHLVIFYAFDFKIDCLVKFLLVSRDTVTLVESHLQLHEVCGFDQV